MVETVVFDGLGNRLLGVLQAGKDPAVGDGSFQFNTRDVGRFRRPALRGTRTSLDPAVFTLRVHQHVTCGIPQLVAEVAVPLDAPEVEADVAAGGSQGGEGETQGVGAECRDAIRKVLSGLLGDFLGEVGLHHAAGALLHQGLEAYAVDQIDGVQHVTLGLRHLVAVRVAHETVDIDLPEGHIARELDTHHDHPCDPEEDDVETSDQDIGGVEGLQAVGSFRPAQRRERPQRRTEPGVEYVFVPGQRIAGGQIMFRAYLVLRTAHVDVSLAVVPRGDTVSPPDLAADTPVLDVAHPFVVGVLPVVGHEADPSVFHCFDGGSRQWCDPHVPLVGEKRLDNGSGAVAAGHHQLVVDDFFEQPLRLEVGDDPPAGLVAVQSDVGRRYQVAFFRSVGSDGGVRS